MPVNTAVAREQYSRYVRARDNGHGEFVEKSHACREFFFGRQWKDTDIAALQKFRRPALTINKIKTTVSTVLGEQIANRSEISFRPRGGGQNSELASVLSKVFKQISDNNQLTWLRTDVFTDGMICGRGFYDVRLDFTDSMMGEVRIEHLNPNNVLLDPDASAYDPDKWNEVFVTGWTTPDDIEVLYGKADADILRQRTGSSFEYGYDSISTIGTRDTFAGKDRASPWPAAEGESDTHTVRAVRTIDRQYRKLRKVRHFVDPNTGDMRRIPDDWGADRIASVRQAAGLEVMEKLVRAIRWTVTADDVVLKDEWSPYNHFTVVPYFPYFIHGRTAGMVEDLLGPQELLNKATSQELHVINTTANSGWKVKAGALTNMTVEELEQKGSMTGLVLEVNEMDGVDKITPNQVPTGLDRVTFKAEEHIKSVSGVNDSMQGFDREDVAARAIEKKRQAGSTSTLSKPLDNLTRTDFYLARNILGLVQSFYTEPRILTITDGSPMAEAEEVPINQPTPEGEILNDLTLGEYDVVITSVPHRETLEDSEFEQAVALRELGVQIPDDVLIDASRLQGKREIVQRLMGDQNSPEAQEAAERQRRLEEAQTMQEEAKAAKTAADAGLSQARTGEVQTKTELMSMGGGDTGGGADSAAKAMTDQARLELDAARTENEIQLKQAEFEHRRQMDYMKLGEQRRKNADDANMRAMQMQQERETRASEMRMQAAQAAQRPQTRQPTKGLRE